MSKPAPTPAIVRVRELSAGMMEIAERGDIQGVLELDALRSRLLHEFFDQTRQLSVPDRELLSEISTISATVIDKIEKMRGQTQDKIHTLGRGKRALAAYSGVQNGR